MAFATVAATARLAGACGPEVDHLRLGIVGAGKLGTTVARAAIAAGYDVAMSASGAPGDFALTVDVLAPGARAASTEDVVRHADIIVLAVPTHRFRELHAICSPARSSSTR
jgi:predicted dinucleotide-binding enzyme